MSIHDLRGKYWHLGSPASTDGRRTDIRTTDYGKGIVQGDYVIIGNSSWHARYLVLDVELNSGADLIYCEHAPRTLAEIEIDAQAQVQEAGTSKAKVVNVPSWVPPEFQLEYRHIAKRRGEEAAAHDVRHMKHEAGL